MDAINELVGVAIIGVVGVAAWQYYICSQRIGSTEPLKIIECVLGTLSSDTIDAVTDAFNRYWDGVKTETSTIPGFYKGCELVYDLETLREMIAKNNPPALDSYDKLSESDRWRFFAVVRNKCGKSVSSMCTGDRRLIEFDANKKLWVSCSAVSLSRAAQKWMTSSFNTNQAHSFILTEDQRYIAQQDDTNQLNGSYFNIAKNMPEPDSRFKTICNPALIEYDVGTHLYKTCTGLIYFSFEASMFMDSVRAAGYKIAMSDDQNVIRATKGQQLREFSLIGNMEINESPTFKSQSAFTNSCTQNGGHFWFDSDYLGMVCDLPTKQLKYNIKSGITTTIYK